MILSGPCRSRCRILRDAPSRGATLRPRKARTCSKSLRRSPQNKKQSEARAIRADPPGAVLDFGLKEYSGEKYLHVISELTEQEVRGVLLLRGSTGAGRAVGEVGERECHVRGFDRPICRWC
jgi:hypothetical protein